MAVLMILILPLVFTLYSVFSNETTGKFAGFVIGLIAGLIALVAGSFFSIENKINSPELWTHTFRFFLSYFLLNTIFGLGAFFLISFSVSIESLKASLSGLFGIFSVVFGSIVYQLIDIPSITEEILFLLIILGSIFIFDFIFNILAENLTIASDFVIYLIAMILFLISCFLGSISLSVFYLASSANYIFIPLGIFITGIILNVILSKIG